MTFNEHGNLKGLHSFLSPSKFHWIRYDDAKLADSYRNHLAVQRGTELHEFAENAIRLGKKLQKSKQTLNMHVNDAIGYRMKAEQPLYYSPYCFGTADAISFKEDKGLLRIHDLKTGSTPASMDQLLVYVALFCLEYGIKPSDIEAILRIYQFDDILECSPDPNEVNYIMERIKIGTQIIQDIEESGE